MKQYSLSVLLLVGGVLASLAQTVITKDSVGTDLTAGASWVGGVAPVFTNTALFDSTAGGTQPFTVPSGSPTWGNIQITTVTTAIDISVDTSTWSLGGGASFTTPIDMSSASENLTFNGVTGDEVVRLASAAGSYTFNVASGRTLTFGSGINVTAQSGSRVLTVTGGGLVIFNGTNNLSSGGDLGLSVTGAGTTVGGTGTLIPNGNAANEMVVVATGAYIAPGDGGIGTLTINATSSGSLFALTMNSGASFKMDLGTGGSFGTPGTSDQLAITTSGVGDGVFNNNNIDFLGTGSTGVFKLFDSDLAAVPASDTWSGLTIGGLSGQEITGGLNVVNLAGGLTGKLYLGDGGSYGDLGDIYLEVTAASASLSWAVGSGNWDINTTANWTNVAAGGGLVKYLEGSAVTFEDSLSGSSPITVNLGVSVNPSSVTVSNASKTFTLSGAGSIAGGTGLTKDGSGTLTNSTANSYVGNTTINAGTLVLGAAGVIPDGSGKGSVVVSGTLDLNTLSETINGLSGSGTIDTVAGGAPTLTVGGNDQSSVFFGTIQNTAGALALVKTGSGTLTLASNSTYSGGTTISGGTLTLDSTTVHSGYLGSGSVTLGNGTTLSFVNNNLSSAALTHSNALAVGPGATATVNIGQRATIAGGLTGSGTLNLIAPSTVARDFWDGPAAAFTGTINLSGGGQIDFRIRNASFDSFAGATLNIDNETLRVRTVDGGNTVAIGALSGTASAKLSGGFDGGTVTYAVGAKNLPTTFAGLIQDSSTPAALTKVGTSTFTLSGTNDYSGVTTVSDGVLALIGESALTNSSAIMIVAPGVLDVTGRIDGALPVGTAVSQTVGGSGTIRGSVTVEANGTLSPGTSAGTLTVATNAILNAGSGLAFELASVTTTGGGTNDLLQVGGDLSLAGGSGTVHFRPTFLNGQPAIGQAYTIITYGGTLTGGAANLALDPTLFAYSHLAATFNTSTAGVITVTFAVNPASIVWQGGDTNVWEAGAWTNWLSGANLTNYYQFDNVTFNDSASSFVVSLKGPLVPATLLVNNSAQDYVFTNDLGGSLSGGAALTKLGTGALTLMTSNSYTGGTLVRNGTISIGSQMRALGTGALTVSNAQFQTYIGDNSTVFTNPIVCVSGSTNKILAYGPEGAGNTGLGGAISGSGVALELVSTNTSAQRGVDFLGNNTGLSGSLKIATKVNLRLRSAASGNLPAVSFDLGNGGAQLCSKVDGTPTTYHLGALAGGATATLSGHESSTGGAGADVTWTIGALNQSTTFDGVIRDGNQTSGVNRTAITKVGSGTLTLTGTNSYTGLTTVSNGTLKINVAYLSSATNVVIASSGKLELNFSGTNVVNALTVAGVAMAPGTYGATGSGAANIDNTHFAGTGVLSVTTGSLSPTQAYLTNSVSGGVLSLSWPAGQGWRLQTQSTNRAVGLRTNWVDVTPGSVTSTNITIDKAQGTVFYRLVWP